MIIVNKITNSVMEIDNGISSYKLKYKNTIPTILIFFDSK